MARTVWACLSALAFLSGGLFASADASNWSVTLDAPNQVASPGGTAIFSGVITNTTGAPLPIDLSLDLLTAPETEDFTIEFATPFLDLGLVVPTSGYSGPLFQATWGAGIPLGTYGVGELLFSAFDPADPTALSTPFTFRTPGVGVFCTESTGIIAASLAMAADDSTNAPVLVYNTAAGLLRYAKVVTETWTSETIQSGIGASANPSVVFDGDTRPHVIYYVAASGDLRYATKPATTWIVSTLDATDDVGASPELTMDGFGVLHAGYFDVTNADLKYAQKTPTSWAIEVVDSGGSVGSESAIAADEAGRPYIAYYDATNEDLKLAYKDAGVWSIETVDATGSVGTSPSIQVRGGIVSIAYRDATAGDTKLRFASGTPGSWTLTTVDDTGDPGLFAQLEINGFGQPRIAYRDAAAGQVKYAVRTDGVTWEFGIVDATSTGQVAFALSRTAEPFVGYLSSGSAVRFASFESCATASVEEDGAVLNAHLVLHPIQPNPFTPSTVISFSVGSRSMTTVRVYDASGRLVAEPFRAKVGPGRVRLDWNGATADGHRLPSGVYMYEVRSGDASAHGRMVLMK